MPYTELNIGMLLVSALIKWSSFSHHHVFTSTSTVTQNFTSGDLRKMPDFTDLEVLENFPALCHVLSSWVLHWECLRLCIRLVGFHPVARGWQEQEYPGQFPEVWQELIGKKGNNQETIKYYEEWEICLWIGRMRQYHKEREKLVWIGTQTISQWLNYRYGPAETCPVSFCCQEDVLFH